MEVKIKPFYIADIPNHRDRSRYDDLVEALVTLPPGKSVRLPRDFFPSPPQAALRGRTQINKSYRVRSKKDADWIYLWLEPK